MGCMAVELTPGPAEVYDSVLKESFSFPIVTGAAAMPGGGG